VALTCIVLILPKLWCWVSERWNGLRIATFYAPVWVVILAIIFIYVRVGMVVFQWRKQLLSLDQAASAKRESRPQDYPMKDLPTSPASPKRYEFTIHSQVPHYDSKPKSTSPRSTYYEEDATTTNPHHARFPSIPEVALPQRQTKVVSQPSSRSMEANKAALSYCKTAMLFFFALLCTW
jgi:hypothetical protein